MLPSGSLGKWWAASKVACLVISKRGHLADADVLVGLDAQAPLGMGQAVFDGGGGVFRLVGAVHGLEPEPFERQVFEPLRQGLGLRIDQLPAPGP